MRISSRPSAGEIVYSHKIGYISPAMFTFRGGSLTDYYAILELEPTASVQEIKRSFRKKVKEQHPDLLKASVDSQKNIRVLIQAYKTLCDPVKREEYNRTYRIFRRSSGHFDYREFLKRREDDLESQAKLIFFDLLHRREGDAFSLYEELLAERDFQIDRYLDREDYMDCAYLLSEEYEKRDLYGRAFELLLSIAQYEFELPYFKHFFYEVERRLQSLVCFKMMGTTDPSYHLRCLAALAALDFPKKFLAQIYRASAETHLKLDNHREAVYFLDRGLELDSKLKGVAKLRQRIGKVEKAFSMSE